MDLEYAVTETIHRDQLNNIVRIDYQFDETFTVEANSTSSMVINQSIEKRTRNHSVTITRQRYDQSQTRQKHAFSFESFMKIIRPLILGYYEANELEQAFLVLDRDGSGTIHVDELSSFLPILNQTITDESLKNYIRKVDDNFDGNISFEEFRSLVLRGIGRDIICNHL